MLKYFLDEELPQAGHQTKHIIKKLYIKRREYRPFHLDCPHTKKKLCYCQAHPIANLPRTNRQALWENYEKVDEFYSKVPEG